MYLSYVIYILYGLHNIPGSQANYLQLLCRVQCKCHCHRIVNAFDKKNKTNQDKKKAFKVH